MIEPLNLDDISYEDITFMYNAETYNVIPVTCKMQLELEALEKKINANEGIQPLIDQLLVLTNVPSEIVETMPVAKLNDLNLWIAKAITTAKKKDVKKSSK